MRDRVLGKAGGDVRVVTETIEIAGAQRFAETFARGAFRGADQRVEDAVLGARFGLGETQTSAAAKNSTQAVIQNVWSTASMIASFSTMLEIVCRPCSNDKPVPDRVRSVSSG